MRFPEMSSNPSTFLNVLIFLANLIVSFIFYYKFVRLAMFERRNT